MSVSVDNLKFLDDQKVLESLKTLEGESSEDIKNKLPEVLLLLSRLPYPPIGGDRLKNNNLIRILFKHFNVHLVVITHEQLDDKTKELIRKYTKSYKIFVKPRILFYIRSFKSIHNGWPLQVNYYYFKDVQRYIDNVSQNVDLIYCTLIRTTKYAENLKVPRILEIADSVGLNYRNSSDKTKSIFWKYVYKFETDKLLSYEKSSIANFDKTLFFNREEMEYFDEKAKTEWIPHGVNEKLLTYQKINTRYKDSVVFFGKMDVQHNIDAVLWLCENVLHNLHVNIKFLVVGAYPKKVILDLAKRYENVEVTNFVSDPYEILQSSLCVVAPMQTGGGIQNKILESMAVGALVVNTSLSATAIEGAKNKREFIVEDDPRMIGTIINDIYENGARYASIKRNARKFIKDNFTWRIYETRLLNVIEQTINSRAERGS